VSRDRHSKSNPGRGRGSQKIYNDVVSRQVDGGVNVVVKAPRLPAQQNLVDNVAIIKRQGSANKVA